MNHCFHKINDFTKRGIMSASSIEAPAQALNEGDGAALRAADSAELAGTAKSGTKNRVGEDLQDAGDQFGVVGEAVPATGRAFLAVTFSTVSGNAAVESPAPQRLIRRLCRACRASRGDPSTALGRCHDGRARPSR